MIDDVEAAARRIAPLVAPTPLVRSAWLSNAVGGDVWMKLEIVQRTGSYKIRGAANALARLRERQPDVEAVVTASAGNHGLAVAWVARALGLRARVYLPAYAPAAKREALNELGAELVATSTYDEAEAQARADAARSGTHYLSPYNDDDVIAGAGTVALEMIAAEPALDAFVVPLGGGGLLSGTAIVARARVPSPIVLGAEAAASPVFTAALAAGRPVTVEVADTLADGLAGNMDLESRTFPLVRDLVSAVVTVPEASIARAMRELIRHERLIAEGSGAIGVAAIAGGRADLAGRRIGVILTGRNVDAGIVERVITAT
jgi:threonine dehydratase